MDIGFTGVAEDAEERAGERLEETGITDLVEDAQAKVSEVVEDAKDKVSKVLGIKDEKEEGEIEAKKPAHDEDEHKKD